MSSPTNRKRLVIYTVGMTPDPIVASLKALASSELVHGWHVDPGVIVNVDTDVVFIASTHSRNTFDCAKTAARDAGLSILNQSEPITVDPYDFGNIRAVVRSELARVIADVTRYDEIVADLTGGTKAMAGALASVALDLLRPGSGPDVYLSYVQMEQDPQGGAARSLPPRLTRLELDDFILREVISALEDGDVDKASQTVEYLSPTNAFREWLRTAVRLQKTLTTFSMHDAEELAKQLADLTNKRLGEIEEALQAIEDGTTRSTCRQLFESYKDQVDSVRALAKAYRSLQKMQRGTTESMMKQVKNLDKSAARIIPLHFLAEAVLRILRGDIPMAIILLYRAIEATLQVEFILREQMSLWDFRSMREKFPDEVTNDSVPMNVLERIMKERYPDAREALDAVEENLRILRDMRNYGVLAHGYGNFSSANGPDVDELVRRVFQFIAALCFRDKKAAACDALQRLTPFHRENEKWLRERANLTAPPSHS